VTGVQTCALPISELSFTSPRSSLGSDHFLFPYQGPASRTNTLIPNSPSSLAITAPPPPAPITITSGSVFICHPPLLPVLIKSLEMLDNLKTPQDMLLA